MADNAPPPRILHITRNLPPLVGGMERLNWHIADELSRRAQVQVVGPRGAAACKPADVEVHEVPLQPLWRFLLASAWRGLRLARQQRPDLVLAGSGLTAPAAWLAARVCGARSAVYVHGLDVAVKHPLYRALWLPAIRRMQLVIANSQPTASLCRHIGVAADHIVIVHPGVELPMVRSAGADREGAADYRSQHGLGDGPILLSVGRLSTRKGLCEFVTHSLPRIVSSHPDAMLVIIGEAPAQALHAQAQSPASIQAAAEAAGVGSALLFLGVITEYQALSDVYWAADVHVFPVREIPGDPEGFGMVAVEAAAHGLPTVAFATGGIVDAVAEGRSGRLVPSGDYSGFADAISKVLAQRDALRKTCMDFAQNFAWPVFGQGVWAALQKLADRNLHE